MVEVKFFERLFTLVDSFLATFVYDTSASVITFVSPIFQNVMIIWIAIWGYMMWAGMSQEPLKEGFMRIIKISFVLTLGLNTSYYSGVVVAFLSGWAEELSGVVSGSSTSAPQMCDFLINEMFKHSKTAWEQGGILNGNLGLYMIAINNIMWVGIATVIIAFLLITSKIATAVLLGMGALFICFTLFATTQKFFESWLSMLMNYGFLQVLATCIGTIMLSMTTFFVNDLSAGGTTTLDTFSSALELALMFGLCILILNQVPSVASAIGGGIALATRGAISGAIGKGTGLASKVRPYKMQRAGRMLKKDGALLRQTGALPVQGVKAAYKRFSSGNSVSQK